MEYFLAELSIHFDNEFSVLSSNLSVSLLTSFSFAFLSALQLLTLSLPLPPLHLPSAPSTLPSSLVKDNSLTKTCHFC